MKGKKGQQMSMEGIPMWVITLVFVGILLAAGAVSLSSFRDNSYVTKSGEANNFTAIYNTAVTFSKSDAVTCSDVSVVNNTGNTVTNYTVSNCQLTLGSLGDNNTNHRASYTAAVTTQATSALNNSLTGGTNFSAQLPTIGTMIGIAMILMVIIGVFALVALKA